MSDSIQIDPWSIAALQIELMFDDTVGGHATCSIWRNAENYYLVTNQHNFTGKNIETGKHITASNFEPNCIKVYFYKPLVGTWIWAKFPIRDNEDRPLWTDLNNEIPGIDLAAIQISPPEGASIKFANEMLGPPILSNIGSDVFVIGFPFEMKSTLFPIWKRASIASEPGLWQKGITNRFFIDTATRSGMSGSLVIARRENQYSTENGDTFIASGIATRLLGIYSGRLGANKDGDAQLGIVWPVIYIEKLLQKSSSKPQ